VNIFSWFFRKRAIKKHVRVLGPALRERFGYKRTYTATQVTDTATSLNLPDKYLYYAIALYCTKEEYERSTTHPQSMVMDYATARAVSFNVAIVTAVGGVSGESGISSGGDAGDGFGGGDGI
jgi:uncharacterized membrane protein YgcG|tara:strand:- start:1636 stop:2001 length:366 start_codon:yes stop_codon:yes gene_type:complete